MTDRNLLQAMGRIAPELIADAAPDAPQKKSANKTWVRWGAVAACFCLIITATIIMIPYLNRDDSGTQSPDISHAVAINGFLYDPLSRPTQFYEKYPELENVTEKITTGYKYLISAEDLGEYIGIVPALDKAHLPEGKAYHWLAYPNLDSIVIVEREENYSFYVSDGLIFLSESINSSSSILEKYNLPDSALNLEIFDSGVIVADIADIAKICEIMSNKQHDAELSYRNRIWEAWLSEKGESGVQYDGKDFSYNSTEIRDEFNAFRTANAQSIWINTENGFEIHVWFNPKFNYFIMCNRTFSISQAESEQLSALLGLK
jgi:hypothetical protein